MNELAKFERELRDLIGSASGARPFVCDGSPLDAEIFLVGFNPATQMNADFWSFWRPDWGFDKTAWRETYEKERAARPLKPGKKFRPKISPTRANIEAFVDGAAPTAVLETNIFAIASETKPELAMENRDSRTFRYLVKRINPRVIVTHGVDAQKAVDCLETTARIVRVPHLSRGWKRSSVRDLGKSTAETVPD